MLSMMTGIELNRALMTIKQQGGKVYSNVFARLEPMKTYDAVVTEESVAFVEEDHGVNRFYFYTIAFEDLKAVTENISIPLTLDIVTRDESEYQSRIYDMGFTLLARMRRLVNKDITDIVSRIVAAKNLAGGGRYSNRMDEVSSASVARIEDAKAVNRILWSTFDTRIGHLLSDEELTRIIEKGEVLIIKDRGEIVTILQRSLDRHQFYINQVINRADSAYIHSLLGAELQKFYDSGGRYLYAWVQDTNIASNKFHAKYDMAFDGLLDLVYVRG